MACTPCAVLPTLVHIRENSKSAGLANANMDSQKLDAILREPHRYYAGPAEAKLDWSGLPTLVNANSQMRALARRITLGGSGGMLPQGNWML